MEKIEVEITPADNGIIVKSSPYPVAETMDRLGALVAAQGMTVFARIDQQEAAARVGLELRLTQLLLFGDPRTGTPLMASHPSLAVDLPLKAVAWEDGAGRVWLSYNDPAFLRQRHGLPAGAFEAVNLLMDKALA